MDANRVPKIFGPFSDVFEDKSVDIQPSRAEQAYDINGPIVPEAGNSPVPVSNVRTDTRGSLVMRFFDKSNKFLGYLHLAKQTSPSGSLSRVTPARLTPQEKATQAQS